MEDILHLYLGCPVMVTPTLSPVSYDYLLTGITTKKINPDDGKVRIQVVDKSGQIKWYDEDEVELLLRPLSSMTEEERKEFNHRKQRKGFMAQIHADNVVWLLSKGFDLFNLIPEGKALDATKVSTTTPD